MLECLHLTGHVGPVLPREFRRDRGEGGGNAPISALLERSDALSDTAEERASSSDSCALEHLLQTLESSQHSANGRLERNDALSDSDFLHDDGRRGDVSGERLDERARVLACDLVGVGRLSVLLQDLDESGALDLVGVGRPAVLLRDRNGDSGSTTGGVCLGGGARRQRDFEVVRAELDELRDLVLGSDPGRRDQLALILLPGGGLSKDAVGGLDRQESAERDVLDDLLERGVRGDLDALEAVLRDLALHLHIECDVCLVLVRVVFLLGCPRRRSLAEDAVGRLVRVLAFLVLATLLRALKIAGAGDLERVVEELPEAGRTDVIREVLLKDRVRVPSGGKDVLEEVLPRHGDSADTNRARHFYVRACEYCIADYTPIHNFYTKKIRFSKVQNAE